MRQSGFTLYRRHKPSDLDETFIRAGQLVRFFHTELEAYMSAEGVFGENVMEECHLRVRAVDQNKPKTMFPPSSAITYWQVCFP